MKTIVAAPLALLVFACSSSPPLGPPHSRSTTTARAQKEAHEQEETYEFAATRPSIESRLRTEIDELDARIAAAAKEHTGSLAKAAVDASEEGVAMLKREREALLRAYAAMVSAGRKEWPAARTRVKKALDELVEMLDRKK